MSDLEQLLQHGRDLLRRGRHRDLFHVALQLENMRPSRASDLDALGTLLTHLEEPARALPYFRRAVSAAPDQIDYRYNLAMAQRMMGELQEAETNLDLIIRARPLDGEAHLARSGLRRQTAQCNHIAELSLAVQMLTGQRAWLPAAFALSKELEDLGEYRRSFAQLQAACRAYRASLRYEVTDDVAVLDKLRSTHTRGRLDGVKSESDNNECIFIVGLPRSGTTLVDRILGSHSSVYSAGELAAFPSTAVAAVAQLAQRPVKKLEFADLALNLDFTKLGVEYLDVTRPRTGHTPKFTDKRPLNCLYAGLIHAALPRARFIALRRHPMDACYAMYKTLFAAEYPFTYDLKDLAQYYLSWDRLMRHWGSTLGESWLEIRYEELVHDPESVSRRMLDHCGLSWEPQCLDFHNRPAAVTTASAAQVRRAIHSDSVGQWRHFAEELAPLARDFSQGGLAFPHFTG
jgi:tetratricopeptide (TPR) repeat protein